MYAFGLRQKSLTDRETYVMAEQIRYYIEFGLIQYHPYEPERGGVLYKPLLNHTRKYVKVFDRNGMHVIQSQ